MPRCNTSGLRYVIFVMTSTLSIKCSNSILQPINANELELELIQTQMTQKPMLRAEVGMRVRCANKASADANASHLKRTLISKALIYLLKHSYRCSDSEFILRHSDMTCQCAVSEGPTTSWILWSFNVSLLHRMQSTCPS